MEEESSKKVIKAMRGTEILLLQISTKVEETLQLQGNPFFQKNSVEFDLNPDESEADLKHMISHTVR